jgi:hypothetical protein
MRVTKGGWVLLLVAGCGSEAQKIDPATAPAQMAARARVIVEQAGQGASSVDGDDTILGRALTAADDASQGLAGGAMRAPLPAPLMGTGMMGNTPAMRSSQLSFLTTQERYDDTARDLEVLIRDRLLAPSNIESKTDTEVVYLLAADPTCRKLPSQLDAGQAAPLDDSCARDLAKLQVRVVLRADGDGARFTVQLGPDRLELSAFVVHSDLLGWESDLDQARRATDYANMALGKAADKGPSPLTRLEGRIAVGLHKLGDKKVTLSFGVLEPVALETKDALFTTGKSDPLIAVGADGVARQLTFTLGLAATEVRTTWDPRGTGVVNKDLLVSIGGLHGATTVSEGSKEILVKGAGIGHSFVAVRGANVFELDFNPAHGRTMDVTLRPAPGSDAVQVELAPRFDVTLAPKLQAIASDYKEPPPAHLRDESYGILLDPGAAPRAVVQLVGRSGGFGGGVKVVAGTLTLSARGAPGAAVAVPAGQCLTGNDHPAAGAHPILGGFAAVGCP